MRSALLPSEQAPGPGPLERLAAAARGPPSLSGSGPRAQQTPGTHGALQFPAAALPGLLSGASGNRADGLEAA